MMNSNRAALSEQTFKQTKMIRQQQRTTAVSQIVGQQSDSRNHYENQNPIRGSHTSKSVTSGTIVNSGDSDDADSGIVAIGVRVGSTSSTDTNPESGSETKVKELHHRRQLLEQELHREEGDGQSQMQEEGQVDKRRPGRVRFDDRISGPSPRPASSSFEATSSSSTSSPRFQEFPNDVDYRRQSQSGRPLSRPSSYIQPQNYNSGHHQNNNDNNNNSNHLHHQDPHNVYNVYANADVIDVRESIRMNGVINQDQEVKKSRGGGYLLQIAPRSNHGHHNPNHHFKRLSSNQAENRWNQFERPVSNSVPSVYHSSELSEVPIGNTKSSHNNNNNSVSKLCTIDPLESTDSMVCAFASVANVILDDSSSVADDGAQYYDDQPEDEEQLLNADNNVNHEDNGDSGDGGDDDDDEYIIEVKPGLDISHHHYETIYPPQSKKGLSPTSSTPKGANQKKDKEIESRTLSSSEYPIGCGLVKQTIAKPVLCDVSRVGCGGATNTDKKDLGAIVCRRRDAYSLKSKCVVPDSRRAIIESKSKPLTISEHCSNAATAVHQAASSSLPSHSSSSYRGPTEAVVTVRETDSYRKSDQSSSIATNESSHSLDNNSSVRLKPDQVYPDGRFYNHRHPDAGSNNKSNNGGSAKLNPIKGGTEVVYAVISKETKSINSGNKKVSTSQSTTTTTTTRAKIESDPSSDERLQSSESSETQPNMKLYQSESDLHHYNQIINNHKDDDDGEEENDDGRENGQADHVDGQTKSVPIVVKTSFFRRIGRIFSKTIHVDSRSQVKSKSNKDLFRSSFKRRSKRRPGSKDGLKTCQSVPALSANESNNEHLSHFKSEIELTSGATEENKNGTFVKNLKSRMSLRRKSTTKIKVKFDVDNKRNSNDKKAKLKGNNSQSCNNLINTSISSPPQLESRREDSKFDGVWGELKQLHSNGSQLIELHRPSGKPFGFFVARGTVNNVKGVFVSRIRDEETQRTLTGLLEIGDEIIAIDGVNVKHSSIIQVNQLIAHKNKITLHVIPFVNHKYR